MATKSSDVSGACSSTLDEFKLNDNVLSKLKVFAENVKWPNRNLKACVQALVSVAHNDADRCSVCSVNQYCDYTLHALEGGWIVSCMMLKIEHHAYCAAVYRLSHSNGKCALCATKHWGKKQTNNEMSRGTIWNHTNTKARPTHIWAPKTQISYRQTRACYSRQGWKTDTVSRSWWCTWQLLVVPHVTSGLLNLIVWCVPVVRRHYSRALVNSSPGSNYKWAVCICMTPGIGTPLNQSHIGYSGCRLSVLLPSFASLPPTLYQPSLCSVSLSCFLSSPALSVFLCSPSMPRLFFPLPITFSLSRISRHLSFRWIAQTVSCQRQRNALTLRGALHLTAGTEAGLHAPAEGEGETGVGESQLWG